MTRAPISFRTVTYKGGCETCFGLAVQWAGASAKVAALRHAARNPTHCGIWYQRDVMTVHEITPHADLIALDSALIQTQEGEPSDVPQ